MAKRGRPRKEISKEQFEKLCLLQCTQEEISGFFGIDHKTLTSWVKREYGEEYSLVYKMFSQDGKISVRRNLMSLSSKSAIAAIFMAKNLLGYTDDGTRKADDETSEILTSINNILHDDEIEGIDGMEYKAEEAD